MPDIVSGILTASCIIFGGYLFGKCICTPNIRTTNDFYIITKEQFAEIKQKYNDVQPLISAPPPEYTAPEPAPAPAPAPALTTNLTTKLI